MGLTTVAECVENKKQVEALKKAGIIHAQGFYFYKPMPLNQLLEICKENHT
jgi:EAL domain-containing protein (putative c-di-GMP-specific phosphodiesterase class I)